MYVYKYICLYSVPSSPHALQLIEEENLVRHQHSENGMCYALEGSSLVILCIELQLRLG